MTADSVQVPKKHTRTRKAKGRILRTHAMSHDANEGKDAQVRAVLPHYQRLLRDVAAWQYRRLLTGERIWNTANPSHISSMLSERYKRSANNQACESLESWAALVEVEVRKIVVATVSDPHRRAGLLFVNAKHAWFQHAPDGTYSKPSRFRNPETGEWETVAGAFDIIPADDMKLLRRIVKHVRKSRVSLPRLGRTRTMKLDGIVAQWEPAKNANSFDYWLRFSTLTKGKPVLLPLNSTRHAEARPGEWTNTAQITVPIDGPIIVRLVRDVAPTPVPDITGPTIGLDFGMRSLFATSEGDLMGRQFYTWLQRIDRDLTELTAALQRQGVKPSESRRYRAMQRRIREHAKNEINRILNRIVDLHGPSVLVVEELDFRGGGLSKRLNRLITRVGRGAVKDKLRNLTQDRHITVVTVPAPYSSQECASCRYVDDRNRNNTRFSCKFCGRVGQADIEAARTVNSRRSWASARRYWSRPAILSEIDAAFEEQWGTDPTVLRARGRRPKTATSSTRPTADGLDTTPQNGRQCRTENVPAPAE